MDTLNFTGPSANVSLLGDRITKGYVVPCDPNPDWKNHRPIGSKPTACWCGQPSRIGRPTCFRHPAKSSPDNPHGVDPRISRKRSKAAKVRWARVRAARRKQAA